MAEQGGARRASFSLLNKSCSLGSLISDAEIMYGAQHLNTMRLFHTNSDSATLSQHSPLSWKAAFRRTLLHRDAARIRSNINNATSHSPTSGSFVSNADRMREMKTKGTICWRVIQSCEAEHPAREGRRTYSFCNGFPWHSRYMYSPSSRLAPVNKHAHHSIIQLLGNIFQAGKVIRLLQLKKL